MPSYPHLCLRLVDQDVSYQLLLQCQAILLAVMLPSRMATDSPSEIVKPNKSFYLKVALITATKINEDQRQYFHILPEIAHLRKS